MKNRQFHQFCRPLLILALILMVFSVFVCGCSKPEQKTDKPAATPDQSMDPSDFSQQVTIEQYPNWIHNYYKSLKWKTHKSYKKKMSRDVLLKSLELGSNFILNNQKPEGNFNYQYDWLAKKMDTDDNQVRQSGALWGLALIYQYDQNPKVKVGLDKALSFFFKHTSDGPVEGSLIIEYPGEEKCATGTVALVALSIIDYLRTEKATSEDLIPADYEKKLSDMLNGYIAFLKYMYMDNKHFSKEYRIDSGKRSKRHSPYFDGETILCLIKAAKYLGYKELVPLIEESSMQLALDYSINSWRKKHDSDKTKGFFQWSCMAFTEYWDAGWKDKEVMGDYVLAMSWWMIHVHETLKKGLNTGYVYEGLTHAYQIAKARDEKQIIDDLEYTMDKAFYKITSWQIGGPLMDKNNYLIKQMDKANDPIAIGGIMNHKGGLPPHHQLRIDVTQHQMHSVVLLLRHVYKN